MLFKRKIYRKLEEWKQLSNGKSAVMLEGARRIGKSTIVEEFAKTQYEDYLILDFANESKDVKRNFEENLQEPDAFFRNLFLLKKKELPRRKAVIIFDEVQLFPPARQAIKYLVADGRYDYIETGSLISIRQNVKDILIPSEEYRLKMFPMDFEEFLWANNDTITFPAIEAAFQNRKPLGEGIHREIMKRFRTYMAVGGMPQAVDVFVSGGTYTQIDFIKRTILDLYREDLKKYDSENREKASVVFQTIPEQLQNHNSHFKFTMIDKNARYKNYVDAVHFISESMIGNECINITEPEIAMEAFSDRSNFKLYMGDTGLLVTQMMKSGGQTGEDIYKSLIFDRLGINQGMIMENMTAQMLRAKGYDLFFHEFQYQEDETETVKKYEIDFLLVKNRKICPIEVKSSGYRTHKSFDALAKKYPIKMQDRYIIYPKDLKYENNILYIPFYMTSCL
ncbi:MAG: AAA family ATPase [Lachnospiraceae bacterium]|nr:AAA family ATPase [Lachnospiraceae bacterium]